MLLAGFPEAAHLVLEPIVCVSKEQAELLAKRVLDVAAFYELGQLGNSKAWAWAMLSLAVVSVYGNKVNTVMALRAQLRAMNAPPMTAAEMNTPPGGNVTPIRPDPTPSKTPGGLSIG